MYTSSAGVMVLGSIDGRTVEDCLVDWVKNAGGRISLERIERLLSAVFEFPPTYVIHPGNSTIVFQGCAKTFCLADGMVTP